MSDATPASRSDGRRPNELRPFTLVPNFIGQALGSVLVSSGRTRVICTANAEPKPPPWLTRGGWVTAQYAMLPGATRPRGSRDPGGRGKEIQRLIGRALRASLDLPRLVGVDGPLSLICDCDVIEADGGTRTASITGAFVALQLALRSLRNQGKLAREPHEHIVAPVAAVSVGIVAPRGSGSPGVETDSEDAFPLLDLCYVEDSTAVVDLNVVMLEGRGLVEVQGTGEQGSFTRAQLNDMLDLADVGIAELFAAQREALSLA